MCILLCYLLFFAVKNPILFGTFKLIHLFSVLHSTLKVFISALLSPFNESLSLPHKSIKKRRATNFRCLIAYLKLIARRLPYFLFPLLPVISFYPCSVISQSAATSYIDAHFDFMSMWDTDFSPPATTAKLVFGDSSLRLLRWENSRLFR